MVTASLDVRPIIRIIRDERLNVGSCETSFQILRNGRSPEVSAVQAAMLDTGSTPETA